ncbi:PorV/PorQ family protein [candidate division FCPU426 bacterium]|nr:PorV/PorQ family protein [candidate division FCPU426 bacterium]
MKAARMMFCLAAALPAAALPVFASTGAHVLEKNVSPRAQAMGEAYVAVADDAYALYRNPAGLSYLRQSMLTGDFSSGLMDDSWGQISYVNAGNPCHTWGIGLLNYNGGRFDLVDYYGYTIRLDAQQDWLLTLGGAYRFTRSFRLGMALEVMHSTLLEHYQASAVAANVGASFNLAAGLRLDATLRHFGYPLQYSYSDPWGIPFQGSLLYWDALPLSVEAGMSYQVLGHPALEKGHDLVLAAGWQAVLDSMPRWHFGLEYWFLDQLAVRAGYKLNRDLETWSAGIGTRFAVTNSTEAQLDYAYVVNKEFNDIHKLEMTFLYQLNQNRLEGARILVVEPSDPYSLSLLKIGLGEGRLYGGVGGNVEIMVTDYFGIFSGLGSHAPLSPGAGLGWAAGCRSYLGPPADAFRGRFSAMLSNGTRYTPGGGQTSAETEQINDFSLLWGFQWRLYEYVSLDTDAGWGMPLRTKMPQYYTLNVGLSAHIPKGMPPADVALRKEEKPMTGAYEFILQTRPLQASAAADNAISRAFIRTVELTKFVNGCYQLSGEIGNLGPQTLEEVEITLVYQDAGGNTLTTARFLPVDPASPYATRKNPLQPGYARRFYFRPEGVPAACTRLAAGVSAVKEGGGEEKKGQEMKIAGKCSFGIGWPYGLVGTNVEIMLADFVGVYGGLGSLNPTGREALAWQAGLRAYLLAVEEPFRLRAGLAYGTAKTIKFLPPALEGVHISLGYQWRIAEKLSMDFDVAYIMPSYSGPTVSPGLDPLADPTADYFSASGGITFHFDALGEKREETIDTKLKP